MIILFNLSLYTLQDALTGSLCMYFISNVACNLDQFCVKSVKQLIIA